MRTKTTAAVLIPLALFVSACGRLNDDGGAGGGGSGGDATAIDHPTGANDLILRVEYEGGFVPVGYHLRRLPSWSLFGDGRIVTEGPQIEIYPAPALPNLLVRTVSEDGIQAILRAARDAGLMDGDATYDYPCVTDLPTTVFTLTADGSTSVVSAYALGVDQEPCRDADVDARADLAAFQNKLGALDGWLPQGSVGDEEPFTPSAVRLYVQPYTGSPDPGLEQAPRDWPLGGSLRKAGAPLKDLEGVRCVALEGQDASTFLAAAADTNQLTPWRSDGDRFSILIRTLLPDESGC
jgi:hypothetical protein